MSSAKRRILLTTIAATMVSAGAGTSTASAATSCTAKATRTAVGLPFASCTLTLPKCPSGPADRCYFLYTLRVDNRAGGGRPVGRLRPYSVGVKPLVLATAAYSCTASPGGMCSLGLTTSAGVGEIAGLRLCSGESPGVRKPKWTVTCTVEARRYY